MVIFVRNGCIALKSVFLNLGVVTHKGHEDIPGGSRMVTLDIELSTKYSMWKKITSHCANV